jgi:4-amino-4-deoxy-L-arabinose transferase-like glycosyltransferase
MSGFPVLLEGRYHRHALAFILLLAFATRILWILAVDVDPRHDFHFDMTFYEIAALRLTDGALLRDFDGTPTAKWSPGYPVLLGSVYFLFGKSLFAGKILNVLLATLTCCFVYLLGTRLFRPGVGLLAAAILAVLPGDVFYSALLLSETAFTAVFTGALLLFVVLEERVPDRIFPRWFGFGVVVGVAILIRGTAGLFLGVPVLIWWISRSSGEALRKGTVAALGLLAAVAPWTVRNYATMGVPVLLSTQQVGMAMTFAHSEIADGGYSQRLGLFRFKLVEPYAELPNPEREIAEWRFEVRRALAYAWHNPRRELRLIPRRLYHLYKHDHAALPWVTPKPEPGRKKLPIFGPRSDRALSLLADGAFFTVLALALAGAWRSFARRRPAALVLPLSVAYVTLLHGVLFAGDPRFHAALLPAFSILAASALLRADPGDPKGETRVPRRSTGKMTSPEGVADVNPARRKTRGKRKAGVGWEERKH